MDVVDPILTFLPSKKKTSLKASICTLSSTALCRRRPSRPQVLQFYPVSHSLSIPISSSSASVVSMTDCASSSSSTSYFDSASSPSIATAVDSIDWVMSPADLSRDSFYYARRQRRQRGTPKTKLDLLFYLSPHVNVPPQRTIEKSRHDRVPTTVKKIKTETVPRKAPPQTKVNVITRIPPPQRNIQLRGITNGNSYPHVYPTEKFWHSSGPTKRAVALAERFRCVIERKRKEWIKKHLQARLAEREGRRQQSKTGPTTLSDGDDSAVAKAIEAELEQEFLHYNVFVLSANEQKMRKDIPHLIMRVSITAEASASAGWELGHGPGRLSNKAVDPKPVGDTMEINIDIDMDIDPASTQTGVAVSVKLDANTVDFAQREKDEMRHLTGASEIISCFPSGIVEDDNTHAQDHAHDLSGTTTASHWDPMVGQVFLGNANDVPLVHEQPVPLMHPQQHQQASQDSQVNVEEGFEGNEDEVLEDDPLHYRSTNDPASAHGFDICIECHGLAPFPSASQLRAAEEHLGMLEKMWVHKCKSRLTENRHRLLCNAAIQTSRRQVPAVDAMTIYFQDVAAISTSVPCKSYAVAGPTVVSALC
ncbi:hypothetical protein M378DRAFT_12852 [Amanita muscaria Koide BX008]|uniref:Uncharacterized protein n=1 Tax=Amanita muscaria (strain Koide BX008) TaxID=946122 RepID=A0A0C2WZS5_AMAMK|nr:hypothetical protein M378DRAFT_12852 [Amanita muscaria Koide BX008]